MMFHFYIAEGICFAATKATKSREADYFRNIKVKHHTHLKMAM
jgi:hypothetical protein